MSRNASPNRTANIFAATATLIAGVALALTLLRPATPRPHAPRSDITPSPTADTTPTPPPPVLSELDAKLKEPIHVDYQDVPLREVFDHLREFLDINLVIDWVGLETAGVAPEKVVINLQLKNVPAETMLDHILQQMSSQAFGEPIAYTTDNNILAVSSERQILRKMHHRIYDVRDLIGPTLTTPTVRSTQRRQSPGVCFFGTESFTDTTPLSRTGAVANAGANARPGSIRPIVPAGGGGGGKAGAGLFATDDDEEYNPAYERTERIEHLLDLIQNTVGRPEHWEFFGGDIAMVREFNGQLILTAPTRYHQELQTLLDALRKVPQPQQPIANVPAPAPAPPAPPVDLLFNTASYDYIVDNPFLATWDNALSTFSIDVDTASYANVRRMLRNGFLPTPGAVRIEEFINYFTYDYSAADDDLLDNAPFAAHIEVAQCPWQPDHQLVRIGLKGKVIEQTSRPATNLVFLIDVSGSMMPEDRLPLLQQAFNLMVDELTADDRIAIVVYASSSELLLDATPATVENKPIIRDAINQLTANGSTNGGSGIQRAYDIATRNFIEGGVNRVILATDGDFNVGTTSRDQLVQLIEAKRKTGVYLSILGVGDDNYQDATMEELSNRGNGNYYYLDTIEEARKVLVQQLQGTLVTIARDVKVQVEFNPATVESYRLIGYENRILAKEDFNDDTIDAGDIGSGHTVTALYEIVRTAPPNAAPDAKPQTAPAVDPLKYIQPPQLSDAAMPDELLTLKLRYKQPDSEVSTRVELPVQATNRTIAEASDDFRFAAAVAAFGMILRDSPHKAGADFDLVAKLASDALGDDPEGYRAQFLTLIEEARTLTPIEVAGQ